MNKAKLVEHMSKATKMPKSACKECSRSLYCSNWRCIKARQASCTYRFWNLHSDEEKSRVGINPATGKKMQIPAKKVPKFRAGKALKAMVK